VIVELREYQHNADRVIVYLTMTRRGRGGNLFDVMPLSIVGWLDCMLSWAVLPSRCGRAGQGRAGQGRAARQASVVTARSGHLHISRARARACTVVPGYYRLAACPAW
jgi:hypothetical protein